VRGTIPVIVDGDNRFLENATEDGAIDPGGLSFGEPEGPYRCRDCGAEWRE
jgi:hypothetical protein